MNYDNLQLSEKEMRKFGYQVIDTIINHFMSINEKSVTRRNSKTGLDKYLDTPIPMQGMDVQNVLNELDQYVFNNIMHLDHPRFFAFVPSPNNFISILADLLASGFNVFSGTWLEASGPTEIEIVTINWLRKIFGFPDTAGGLFVSGGSMANLTALTIAKQVKLNDAVDKAIIYCSDQTHSSVERGINILGFKRNQFCKIQSDEKFRLDLSELKTAVNYHKTRGFNPFCVIANAGSTNTGAIDPLKSIADFCRKENLWLHIDGAYGAPVILTQEGREKLDGINLADSLSIDPHKWLFQSLGIGCVIVRNNQYLKETFQILPEYLKDAESINDEVNFADCGIELTRSFRALKLWMTLKVFGLENIKVAISKGIILAEHAECELRNLKNWQIITPAQMGVITFRYIPKNIKDDNEIDQINRQIAVEIVESGFAMIATTVLKGKTVLRLCIINPRTSKDDISNTIHRLEITAGKIQESYVLK